MDGGSEEGVAAAKPAEEDGSRFLGTFYVKDSSGYMKTFKGNHVFRTKSVFDEWENPLEIDTLYSFSLTKSKEKANQLVASNIRFVRKLAPTDSIVGRIDALECVTVPGPNALCYTGTVIPENDEHQRFQFDKVVKAVPNEDEDEDDGSWHYPETLTRGQLVSFVLRPCEEDGCYAELV